MSNMIHELTCPVSPATPNDFPLCNLRRFAFHNVQLTSLSSFWTGRFQSQENTIKKTVKITGKMLLGLNFFRKKHFFRMSGLN